MDLRKMVEATEQTELKRSLVEARKRQELTEHNKQLVRTQRELDDKKGRLERELNKYKRSW